MPDRVLRAGYLTSKRYNGCSIQARELFLRLLSIADDYGVADARASVIAAFCYPTDPDPKPIPKLLDELHAADLIQRFEVGEQPYLAIQRWAARVRGKRKYPAPPQRNNMADHPPVQPRWGAQFDHGKAAYDIEGAGLTVDSKAKPAFSVRHTSDNGQSIDGQATDNSPANDGHASGNSQAYAGTLTASRDPRAKGVRGKGKEERGKSVDDERAREEMPRASNDDGDEGSKSTKGNGVTWNGERFAGITEALELRWQSAFPELRIPVEIEQAGVWLAAHPQSVPEPELLESFLARWLLRSASGRPMPG